jgi:hypothetical protein
MTQKIIILIVILGISLGSQQKGVAQNELSQSTQVEVSLGWVAPFLQSGRELTRAENLRNKSLSYFAASEGNRQAVGSYAALSGISFGISFYKPVRWAKGLMLGATVRNSQTGSEPDEGGYVEAYYFNFVTAGVAAKYYPFTDSNWFVKGDFGLGAVFTKNRFLNETNEQRFFHQFGIGNGASVGLGYAFTPFADKTNALELQVMYQQLSTRVEVDGIGDDQWRFGALHLGGSINF